MLLLFVFRPRKLVWHGAGPWGDPAPINCGNWRSDDALAVGAAADLDRGRLLGQVQYNIEIFYYKSGLLL